MLEHLRTMAEGGYNFLQYELNAAVPSWWITKSDGKLQLAASDSHRCNSFTTFFPMKSQQILFLFFFSLSLSLSLAHILWAMNGYEICTIETTSWLYNLYSSTSVPPRWTTLKVPANSFWWYQMPFWNGSDGNSNFNHWRKASPIVSAAKV